MDEGAAKRKRRRGGWDQPAEVVSDVPFSVTSLTPKQGGWDQPCAAIASAPTVLLPSIATTSGLSCGIASSLCTSGFQLPGFSQNYAQPKLSPSPVTLSHEFLQLQAGLASQPKLKTHEGCRIYVGALAYELTQENVKALFSPFGNIVAVDLSREPGTTRSKGFCFVEFDNRQSAEAAMALNGFELAGRNLKVGWPAGPPVPSAAAQASVPNLTISSISFGLTPKEQAQMLLSQALNPHDTSLLSLGGTLSTSTATSTSTVSALPAPPQKPPLPTGPPPPPSSGDAFSTRSILVRNIAHDITLDMLRTVFASFGNVSSVSKVPSDATGDTSSTDTYSATMQFQTATAAKEAAKNMRGFPLADHTLGVDLIPDPVSHNANPVDVGPLVSLVLHNMVSVEDASDPDLKDEVAEECSRHGPLATDGVSVVIDGGSVIITVTYVSAVDAKKAYDALNGRYFAGRVVKAVLQIRKK